MTAPIALTETDVQRVARLMRDPDAVFVFGSNLAGIHGAGAAKDARKLYGAEWARGEGHFGRSYAIPTKRTPYQTLSVGSIEFYVSRFLAYAEAHPELTFVVTRIGCGYAGYTDADIAPLFAKAPANCELPLGWRTP